MSKTAPPVPPANRSKRPTEQKRPADGKADDIQGQLNPDKKGQQANTKQNTRHQGYQQDR